MIELTNDECKAMRDIASGRPPAIESEVVEQLKARKLINVTLGRRISEKLRAHSTDAEDAMGREKYMPANPDFQLRGQIVAMADKRYRTLGLPGVRLAMLCAVLCLLPSGQTSLLADDAKPAPSNVR